MKNYEKSNINLDQWFLTFSKSRKFAEHQTQRGHETDNKNMHKHFLLKILDYRLHNSKKGNINFKNIIRLVSFHKFT